MALRGPQPGLRPEKAPAVPVLPIPDETVYLPHGPVCVRWRRSARARRVSLRIDARTTDVIVTLPLRVSRERGLDLLHSHSGWVASRLRVAVGTMAGAGRFVPGGQVAIDGVSHEVRHCPEARGGAWLEDGALCVSGDVEFLARRLAGFLRVLAQRRLAERVAAHAQRTGLVPSSLVIRDTSSRWGSCTVNGRVMLSWRLVMAPLEVQEYIIVHELAHLRHMNHGEAFWALVDVFTPFRKTAEAWLRRHGAALMRAG